MFVKHAAIVDAKLSIAGPAPFCEASVPSDVFIACASEDAAIPVVFWPNEERATAGGENGNDVGGVVNNVRLGDEREVTHVHST